MRYLLLLITFSIFLASPLLQAEGRPIYRSRLINFHKYSKDDIANLFTNIDPKLGGTQDPQALRSIMQSAYPTTGTLFGDAVRDSYEPAKPEAPPFPVILKHFRSDQGIPFPDPSSFNFPGGPHFEIPREKLENVTKLGIEAMKQLAKPIKIDPLPDCKKDQTLKERVSKQVLGNDKTLLLDMLFTRDDAPLDSSEIFGIGTMVVPYRTNDSNPMALLARRLGVTCLPFRIRSTESTVMRDTGMNALRNYDQNPHKQGVFHEYIRAKYKMDDKVKKADKSRSKRK
ncbi:MAG: hypothetical protein DCC75_12460 [Proteobacteria bacterium]|nr:MAG: hypothetical protein DCC75_12460 [Pseudomonadota bacterium]